MERAEKLSLLLKILKGKPSTEILNQLRQSNGPGAIVIIYRHGASEFDPNDEASFHHKGKEVTIPFKDIQVFTRFDPLTIFMIPDNGRRDVPDGNHN